MWLECPFRSALLATGSTLAACTFVVTGISLLNTII